MSPWHLLWIIPLCFASGVMFLSWFQINREPFYVVAQSSWIQGIYSIDIVAVSSTEEHALTMLQKQSVFLERQYHYLFPDSHAILVNQPTHFLISQTEGSDIKNHFHVELFCFPCSRW